MSLSARKIPSDAEREERILLAIDDVTDRRADLETLREAAQRKDEFLAMLAHELRNPLTPITHAIHLLQGGKRSDQREHLQDMIERQTQRMVRLVDDLLDVARINRGLIEVKRQPLNLVEVIVDGAEACRHRIDERRHALSLELPDAAVPVDGDRVRLEQVVCNLLENAAKYTEPGGRIDVTLTREHGEAVLRVRDTGIGIPKEARGRIFDLFGQVDRTLARSSGGLGLGLTVVRRVLDLHGGHIEARSAGLGKGSEFIVRLPLLAAAALPVQSRHRVEENEGVVHPRRVLIVDDNVDSAQSLAMLVRGWGHEVEIAHEATRALSLVESFNPEAALVDIGLPGMDGYELARRLRQLPAQRDMHLVAMTGYGRDEDRTTAHQAGFDAHVVKPANIDELQAVIGRGRL